MWRWLTLVALVTVGAGLLSPAAEPAPSLDPESHLPALPTATATPTATPTASPFPTVTPTVTPSPTETPWATPAPTTPTPTPQVQFPFVPGPQSPAHASTLPSLGAVTLRWALPPGATQYQVQLIPANSDGPGVNLIRTAEDSYTIRAPVIGQGPYILLPGTRYRWRLRATDKTASAPENDPSWGRWSEYWNFRTARPSPTGLSAASPADRAEAGRSPVSLTWANREDGIFYYEIQVSQDERFRTGRDAVASVWWNLAHGGASEPPNSWRTPPLEAGAVYFWRVRPRVQGGEPAVEWGPTWRFTTAARLIQSTPTPVPTATPRPAGNSTPIATPAPPRIAFVSNRDGNTELYSMSTDGSGQTRLTVNDTAEDTMPAWSPDGTRLAYSAGSAIAVISRDGREARTLAPGNGRPAWSPDGQRIAYTNAGDLWVMNADGSHQTRLTDNTSPFAENLGIVEGPKWSPDGLRIAVTAVKSGASDVWVMLGDGTGRRRLTGGAEEQPAWSPDGRRLAVVSKQDGMRQIYVMQPDGGGQTRLTSSGIADFGPVWSPDGTYLAFVSLRDGNAEIYVMNADGTNQTRLTRNDAQDEQPAWSPDGRAIAFTSGRDGNSEIYVMNIAGSGLTNLSQNATADAYPAWSPR